MVTLNNYISYLNLLLDNLKNDIKDPNLGLELIIAFYEADSAIYNVVEESDYRIDDLFSTKAQELFLGYASQIENKEIIFYSILNTNKSNYHYTNFPLIEFATKCLSKELIQQLIKTLSNWIDTSTDFDDKTNYLRAIESLAKQIKDAPLFEKTKISLNEEISCYFLYDIAQVYFESGDYETAYSRLIEVEARDYSASEYSTQ